MSLKLGKTNIAGTQVLYSTTGNNTDGAMTQNATTTELNNCVHKTGNETISGEKSFTNTLREETVSTSFGSYVDFIQEINNNRRGTIRTVYNSDGSYSITLGSNGPDASAPEGIKVTRNSSTIWATAPASDANNSIVTTINKSKSANGHFTLGNGLTIQWGRSSTTDGYVTFPTPFNNVCTAVIPTRISSGDAQSNIFENASTTRFKIKIYGGYSSSSYFYWIAVGY